MQNINDISERHAEVMGLNFRKVTALPDIETVSQLAREVWHQHYMPIIGAEQVDYMLNRFQNVGAITSQIESGYQYYLVQREEQALAYFGILPAMEQKSLHISKLYVCPLLQRTGLGTRIIGFIEQQCRCQHVTHIWLTVNRHNQNAINFYLRSGFLNTGSVVQDIGAGFVMDDFKMEKNLNETNTRVDTYRH